VDAVNILLLGGPFHWRTMRIPQDYAAPIHIPIPSKVTMAEPSEFSLVPDFQVATYRFGEFIFNRECPSGGPGATFYYERTQ